MSKLFYLPLEPYEERYTSLMSKKGGWAESHFEKLDVRFIRVEGRPTSGKIKTGSVVDAFSRSRWAMDQVNEVMTFIEDETLTDGDVIYTEDFWHPGIESLFYIRDITGVKFKIGCFMHAQSIDDSDFTYTMRYWIGDVEKGFSTGYDYVFVTSPILLKLALEAGWNDYSLKLSGLPLNKEMLLKEYGHHKKEQRERFVLFSSRFDAEKNPHFFLDLVEKCPDINFKLVKPRDKLSNDPSASLRAYAMSDQLKNFEIVDTSNKETYYKLLGAADVQFNCAIQDWVSWTLLEAVTFGCKPLYPKWKDFPYELKDHPECLYDNKSLRDAESQLRKLLWGQANNKLIEIADRHDNSWYIKLKTMGLI